MTYQYRKGIVITHKTYINLICNQGVRGSSPCGGTIFYNNFNDLAKIRIFDCKNSNHIATTDGIILCDLMAFNISLGFPEDYMKLVDHRFIHFTIYWYRSN